jgi:hypothetical protein
VVSGSALLVAGETALANLLAAEIRLLAGWRPEPMAASDLRVSRHRVAGRHVIATLDCLPDVYSLPEDQRPSRVTQLSVDPLHHLRDFIRRLRSPATVGVVSSSDKIRDLVSAGIWRLRGEEVAVCSYTSLDTERARRDLEIADFVLADPGLLHGVPKPRSGGHRPRAPLLLISCGEAGFLGSGNLLDPGR